MKPVRRKIKLLIVEDSMVYRELLARGMSTDPDIEIVGVAQNPFEAIEWIERTAPDVMTCDIEMPRMNGIEFIRQLLPQYAIPVIVVSTVSRAVLDAMHAGAIDFVTKPQPGGTREVESFIRGLIGKVKMAASANHRIIAGNSSQARLGDRRQQAYGAPRDVILIGASTGGTEAIREVLRQLPPSMPGIAVVQHIPPVFSRMFAERLHATTSFRVKEAQTGDVLERGTVLIAPGNRHMRLIRNGETYFVRCEAGEKVNGHIPSVDVLFESAAKAAGPHAIAVLLTGMGYDGAKGMLAIRRKGGHTIGQDEASSVIYGMPRAAQALGGVDKEVPLSAVGATICKLLTQKEA